MELIYLKPETMQLEDEDTGRSSTVTVSGRYINPDAICDVAVHKTSIIVNLLGGPALMLAPDSEQAKALLRYCDRHAGNW